MGIPKYFSELLKKYPKSVSSSERLRQKNESISFDHIYFDLNNLLYSAARKADNENSLYDHLFRDIEEVLKTFHPMKTIYFAVDGSGSVHVAFVFEQLPNVPFSISIRSTQHREQNYFFRDSVE